MNELWWRLVYKYYVLTGRADKADDYAEHQGMRKAIGGRWGRWEVQLGQVMGRFKIWLPACCEAYPAPPCATSTEPLETEDYTLSAFSRRTGPGIASSRL